MVQIVAQSIPQNKDSGLVVYAKHILILISLGALILPAIVLGQTPQIKIHTGVPPQALLNSRLQLPEKRDQEVVRYRLMLSDAKNSFNLPSGITGASGAELLRGTSLPPLSPLQNLGSGAVGPSANAGGFVGDRLRDLQKMLGDTQNSLVVLEGNSKTFEVSLIGEPLGNVTITITGHEDTDLEVDPTVLMFDNMNWSVGKTVTVSAGQDDDDAGETVTLTLTGSENNTGTIDITILDDEQLWELPPQEFDEGDVQFFPIPLLLALAPPSEDVTFTITGHEDTNLILGETTLTFPVDEWQDSQLLTLGSELNPDNVDEYLTLTLTASGGGYTGLKYTMDVTILNDPPWEILIPEGGTVKHSLRLIAEGLGFSPPTFDIVATLSGHEGTDLEVDPVELIFPKDKWHFVILFPGGVVHFTDLVTSTLTAGEDTDNLDDQVSLEFMVTGPSLPENDFLGPPPVSQSIYVRIEDDDDPGLILAPSSLEIDEGGSNSFMVKLSDPPLGELGSNDVTVRVPSFPGFLTSNPSSLTFTSSDWGDEQTVTLTSSHDDDFVDDTGTLWLEASGGGYDRERASVEIEIIDDDTPDLVVSSTSVTINEGETTTFTVSLNGRPSEDVVVAISVNQGADGELDLDPIEPENLIFGSTDWFDEKEIKLTAKHDDDFDDESETLTLTASGYFSGTETVRVDIVDDDIPGLVVSPTSITVDEGGTMTFRVRLEGEPSDDVQVGISGYAGTDLDTTASVPRGLTLMASSWEEWQSVTLGAKHDDDSVNDPITLTLTATGGIADTETVSVEIKDDDEPGIVVEPQSLTIDEGQTATFRVKLETAPSGNVMVTLSDDGDSDLTWSGRTLIENTLVFSLEDWHTLQTVTVGAEHDRDGVADEMETLRLTATGAAEYIGKTGEVTVAIKDDEDAGIVVSPSVVTVTEGSSGSPFTVALSAKPTADVTITLSDDRDSDLTWSGSTLTENTLTLTPENYRTPQTVTLRAEDDRDGVADETETLRLTATGASEYEGKIGEITVTIKDDEEAGIVVNPSVVTVAEESLGSPFTVALSAKPTAGVTVTIRDDGDSDLTWSGSTLAENTLTFTPADYGTQTVILMAGPDDDGIADETETLRLIATGAAEYEGKTSEITVTIKDDEQAGIVVNPSMVTVTEGRSGSAFTVTLSAQPTADVTIMLSNDGDSELTWSGSTLTENRLTFTPENHRHPQTVALRAEHDRDGVADETETLRLTATGAAEYEGKTGEVTVTIKDDEQAGIVVDPSVVTVTEGSSGNAFSVVLSAKPTAGVTVTIRDDGDSDLTWSGSTLADNMLTFTPENYRNLQTVTLRAEDDRDGVADETERLRLTATGAAEYEGKTGEVTVTIKDDEQAGIVVNPSVVTVAEESLGSPFTVALSAEPTADVMVTLSDDGDSDLTWSGSTFTGDTLKFTPEDYGAQTVILTAEPDDDGLADEMETLVLSAMGAAEYEGKTGEVTVTIKDDEQAGIVVNPSVVTVTEGGLGSSFTVALSAEPTADVTVMLGDDGDSDLIWSGSTLTENTLTFTPENHRTPQTVTLRAEHDRDGVADEMETLRLTASGAEYSGVTTEITVTIEDDDEGMIVVPSPVTMTEGITKSFDVSLSDAPSDNVTVTISGYGSTDLADPPPSPLNLVFTPRDYNLPQSVTLTASEDDNDLLDESVTLYLTASGAEYTGVTANVTIMIMDDDEGTIVVPSSVTVEEGSEKTLNVALSLQPAGTVTINISGHEGTDLEAVPPSPLSLTFTPTNYHTTQLLTLSAAEDDDYADEQETLTLTAGGGSYAGVTANIPVTITDNDDESPLAIAIYDVQGSEDAGNLQLPVELSRSTDQVVTVQYASADGTAEAGLDYTASRGIVIFDPNATRGVIMIDVTDDDISEGTETFAVTLSKPRNAIIARGTGTGTILDDDGGSAILQVDDALVLEEEGKVQFRVSLSHPQRQVISVVYETRDGTARAGEDYEASSGVVTLAPGTIEAMITVPLLKDGLDWREETFTVHLVSSKHAEIGKAVGVATIQESTTVSEEVLEAYAARFVRTTSVQVVEALRERFSSRADGAACGAAARAEMARLWYSASSWDPSLGELLAGCRMSATSFSGSFSVWGRGAFRQFNGQRDDGLTLRGEVTTGMLGADYRWRGGWLAGVLFAHSQGEGSFEVVQQSGEITAGLTGVYPYVSYARTGWDVWLSAGAARGRAEVLQLTGDLVSRFGAMGVRGTLASTGTIGFDYHGDVLVTNAEMKDHAVMAEVYRIRAGVEANARISDGLRPYVEANVRSDGGSAETGVGLEFGGGIRVAYPAWGLKGDVRSQGLVMHTADGFTEWGISGSLQVGSRPEGLMVRVRPTWGRGRGMSIYGQQTILDAAPIGENTHRTELELEYGAPWRDGTVRSIMGVTRLPRGIMYRLGSELHPWERVRFSVFGLAHGRAIALRDFGVNVRGSLRY